jgi:DNA invertase Pin-like site-specific DNA recombinase
MNGNELAPTSRSFVSPKINATHLTQLAIVYVRQSTPQQVVEHRESLARQYALAQHAQSLGWPESRVQVIDEDLGLSGRSAEGRPGFQRLLAEVTMGHVGLVLGLEMSRLARSCRDWYQLLEVCGIFGTLLADQDGLYDPSDPNDRLLLGLKGQISELELHTIRSRLDRGRLNKAQRGELFLHAPTGYVRTPGGLAKDPDEQARSVVQLIFDKFKELRSAHAVVRYFHQQQIRLPVRQLGGPDKGTLRWKPAGLSTVFRILRNPAYAGTYAFGQHVVDPKRRRPGGCTPSVRAIRQDQWLVTLHDRIPAFITWEQYQNNCEIMRRNRNTASTPGVARRGVALLNGLVVCGRCGNRMNTMYGNTATPRYECLAYTRRGEAHTCKGLTAAALDTMVTEQLMRVLTPAGIELALRAEHDVESERHRVDAHWRAELERRAYDVRLAERSYRAVDPENRLVARTLDQQWEQALRAEQEAQENYTRFSHDCPKRLTLSELNCIRTLAADVPALWRAADTPPEIRKEIARTLIERVTVTIQDATEITRVRIDWVGGTSSEHSCRRPISNYNRLADYEKLKERVRSLVAEGKTSSQVADQLNRDGFRPPSSRVDRFSASLASGLIYRLGFSPQRPPAAPTAPNEWSLHDLAGKLGVSLTRLRHWVQQGYLNTRIIGKRPQLLIWADRDEIKRLLLLRDHPRQTRLQHYPTELTRPKVRPADRRKPAR